MKPILSLLSLLMVLSFQPMALALTEPQQEDQSSASLVTHTVRPGDSFDKIARANGCTIGELAAANGLPTDAILQLGQQLKMPAPAAAETPPYQTANTPPVAEASSHTIKAGDTFSKIAKQYEVSVDSLISANPTVKPTALRPGQKILLPASSKTAMENLPQETKNQPANTNSETETPQNSPNTTVDALHEADDANPILIQRTARTIATEREMTYGELAAQYGTETDRLNSLNGLDLQPSTVVVKGADLLVPVTVPR